MDMESLMAQARSLQNKVASAQEELATKNIKGIAGAGAVIVSMTGKYDLISVTINPETLSLGAETVSKLVAEAYRDAKSKADILIDKVMNEATGGLNLPQ